MVRSAIHDDAVQQRSIAVVGMAGRFPGADSIDALWELLCTGREAARALSDEDLRSAGVDEASIADPNYVKLEMMAPDSDGFDAAFFGLSARQAALIDPQQRMFLECSWEALENAGYATDNVAGPVGVFAGSGTSFHLFRILMERGAEGLDLFQSIVDADKDFLATRTSYKLGLTGPSIGVQTACSTSLVAVHLAAQSLLNFECDMALAGGVSLSPRVGTGYLHIPGGIAAADGHCRAYDAGATGMVTGSGAAVVAMKRLADALADGDNVRAIIRATTVNNDGADKVGFTAPGLRAQTRLIATALVLAGVEPDDIGMIEGHGTGTALGDMIELTALHDVFAGAGDHSCALGSIKSNIGHLDTASGVTGLVKAILCLEHRRLVPSLHLDRPNGVLTSRKSPFFVPTATGAWPSDPSKPRLAGVSSMGIGGTNAHLVVEEPPRRERSDLPGLHIFPLSAKIPGALEAGARALAAAVRSGRDDLADIAYTLQVGRNAFPFRAAIVAGARGDLADRLTTLAAAGATDAAGSTALNFPASGGNLVGSAHRLYGDDRGFREDLDSCANALAATACGDPRAVLLDGEPGAGDDTVALFVLEYCLGNLWLRSGLKVDLLLGTGVGELAAACVGGAVSLAGAVAILRAVRGDGDGSPFPACSVAMPAIPTFRLGRGRLTSSFDVSCWKHELLTRPAHDDDTSRPKARRSLEVLADRGAVERSGTSRLGSVRPVVRSLPAGLPPDRRDVLELLADMWLSGAIVDWDALHRDELRRRVELPTYVFQRQRCTVERPSSETTGPAETSAKSVPSSRRPSDEWLYAPGFAVTANPAPVGDLSGRVFLIFARDALADRLVDRVRSLGGRALTVTPGSGFCADGDRIVIDPAAGEHYAQAIGHLVACDVTLAGVIHCWALPDRPESDRHGGSPGDEHDLGYASILQFMQAWRLAQPDCSKTLLAVTSGAYDLQGDGKTRLAAIVIAPLCMVISQEQAEARCSLLDLPEEGRVGPCERYVDWIISETVRPRREMTVAYTGNRRMTTAYEPVTFEAAVPAVRSMREGGVYILVGGLGGIGSALAQHLSERYRARIGIVSRRSLPPRESWQDAVTAGHPDARTIERLLAIGRSGGSVTVEKADIGSREEMTEAIARIERTFGPANGVYHLAVAQDHSTHRPWHEMTGKDLTDQLWPKVGGLQVLKAIFADRELDFAVSFSSKAAILGGFGFAAYAAANAALDSVVANGTTLTPRWLAINWGGWRVMRDVVADQPTSDDELMDVALSDPDALDPNEGLRHLDDIVTRSTLARVVVSPTALERQIETWARHRPDARPAVAPTTGSRPADATQRANSLRTKVVKLVKSALAVEAISEADTFHDLGGNSLLALRVQYQVQKQFGIALPQRILADKPIIAGLVDYLRLGSAQAGQVPTAADDRVGG